MGTPRHLLTRSLATLAVCVLLAATAAVAEADPGRVSVSAGAQVARARHFWTPERMRRAEALPSPLPGDPRLVDGVPGSTPAAGLPSESVVPTETIADPTLPGFSQNGAVFVVGRFGTLGRCSGTSVNAPNFSLVITAGHCVHEGRHWMGHKWVFVPGYRYGERPFGTFVAKWLGSTPQWIKSENTNFDVGAAVVSRNERGQRLADAVGGADIAWNLSPKQVFDVYGYPVAPPFDGSTLQHCAQTPFEGHAFFSLLAPGPLNLAVHCEISAGASGGGWLISGKNVLNGVTADGYLGDDTDYGPYFGQEVGKLFSKAAKVK
jgi:V8-like Glu-specific endopeptidase